MKRWAALLCTLALMALIFALSAQPGAQSASLSNAALEAVQGSGADVLLPQWFDARAYANIRKWAHIYLYAALGVSMAATVHLWVRRRLPVQMTAAAALCLLYAASDELHQFFVPGRAAQLYDVCVDSLGLVPGIAAVWLFLHWRARRRQTKQK